MRHRRLGLPPTGPVELCALFVESSGAVAAEERMPCWERGAVDEGPLPLGGPGTRTPTQMSGPAGSFVTTGVQVISNMLCEQIKEAPRVQELRLGIDLACRESHRAALADETGKILWSNRRLFTTSVDLQSLWTAVRAAGDVPVLVVMEPTRNAWVPVAAWLRARGADVRMVPP